MNATIARYIALPTVAAGILGGAAIGLATVANAGTYSYDPTPRPGIVATPTIIARPPVLVIPGHRWHHDRGQAIGYPPAD